MLIATTPPTINQVQFSPFEYRRQLLAACQKRDVVLEAYSPARDRNGASRTHDVRNFPSPSGLGRRTGPVLLRSSAYSVEQWLISKSTPSGKQRPEHQHLRL